MSSRGDDEARRRSASAGADAHVEKGIAPGELVQLVDRVSSKA